MFESVQREMFLLDDDAVPDGISYQPSPKPCAISISPSSLLYAASALGVERYGKLFDASFDPHYSQRSDKAVRGSALSAFRAPSKE